MGDSQAEEPPDGAMVLLGEPPLQVVLVRDDVSANDSARWFPPLDQGHEPARWDDLISSDPDVDVPEVVPHGVDRSVVVRLYTQTDLDLAVAQATVTPVGEHLMEPSGWCRTCGVQHSHVEWARLHDRLEEEQ